MDASLCRFSRFLFLLRSSYFIWCFHIPQSVWYRSGISFLSSFCPISLLCLLIYPIVSSWQLIYLLSHIPERIQFKLLLLTFNALNGLATFYLSELLNSYSPPTPLCSSNKNLLQIPPPPSTQPPSSVCLVTEPVCLLPWNCGMNSLYIFFIFYMVWDFKGKPNN